MVWISLHPQQACFDDDVWQRGQQHAQHRQGCLFNCFTLLAGAYWRGDESRAQLQRIYGTAWETKDQLKAYQQLKVEAARRSVLAFCPTLGGLHAPIRIPY